jgi:Uma2 family endonuclease
VVAPELTLAPPPDIDERVILRGVSWADYERLVAMRGESSAVRITYLRGALELMSPSSRHELDKKKLARIFETYADALGIEIEGVGSWTVRREKEQRGAEPDECYVVGSSIANREAPDIVIEVVYSSGGLPKLEVWRRLGVSEVWFWLGDRLSVYVRRGDEWVSVPRSDLLPAIDLALVERCMTEPSQTAAVKALRAAIAS